MRCLSIARAGRVGINHRQVIRLVARQLDRGTDQEQGQMGTNNTQVGICT